MATVEQQRGDATNGGGPERTTPVENPATGEVIAHVPSLTADEVKQLVDRARRAQPAWEALGFEARARIFKSLRRWLVHNRERVIRTLMEENGKTWEDAQLGELVYNIDALGFWAKNAPKYLRDEKVRPHSPFLLGRKVIVRHKPFGVVGVIGPWNYPLTNNFGDALPALAAGNSVVLKPASITPLTSLLMQEGWRAVGGPEDVFLVATGGGGEVGGALIDNVDMVHFTGSTETGRKIMEQAATRLLPVTLELGGKDPLIVLEDADLDRAANCAVFYSMQNGGQTCISVERAYVVDEVHDEFVRKVVDVVGKMRQGAPGDAGSVEIGAITSPDQGEIVEAHVKDAVEKGAKIETGGHRRQGNGKGDFFEPTILTNVNHSMECMTEETFGPTLPIMRVKDADEAIRLANESPYGLDSSIFTKDLEKGERLTRRLEAGAACVNDALINYLAVEAPFGGVKQSGIGARHGAKGIQKYTQTQQVMVTRFAPRKEIHFFPYNKRVTKLIERMLVLLYGRGGQPPLPRRD